MTITKTNMETQINIVLGALVAAVFLLALFK